MDSDCIIIFTYELILIYLLKLKSVDYKHKYDYLCLTYPNLAIITIADIR